MKTNLSWLLGIVVLVGLIFISFVRVPLALSATNHIVISEIRMAGAADDFVELYNPTDSDINLNSYRLVRRTANGDDDTGIKAFAVTDIIPAHGFFLWCNSDVDAILGCDSDSGSNIANNNSVALRNGPVNTEQLWML